MMNSRLAWSFLLGLAAAITNLLLSNDWCCSSFLASVTGALGFFIVDRFFLLRSWSLQKRLRARIVVGVCLLVVCSLVFRVSEKDAMQLVFQTYPSTGLSEISVTKRFMGGPGDHLIMMQFKTNESTMQALLVPRNFQEDPETVRLWREVFRSERTIWEHVFGGLFPKDHRWNKLPLPDDFAVYVGGDGITPNINILWDRSAGIAYVMYSFG